MVEICTTFGDLASLRFLVLQNKNKFCFGIAYYFVAITAAYTSTFATAISTTIITAAAFSSTAATPLPPPLTTTTTTTTAAAAAIS